MSLFSKSKSATTSNVASDRSNILGNAAQMGTINLGSNARYQEAGSVQNSGTLKTGALADAKITAQQGSTVTIGETGLGQTFADAVKDIVAGQGTSNRALLEALVGQTRTATAPVPGATINFPGGPDAPAEAPETKTAQNPLVWLGLALAAGLAWWAWKK